MKPIFIKKSIWKSFLTDLSSVAFVVIGYYMANSSDNIITIIIGWLGVIFFGLATVILIITDFKSFNEPVIIIEDHCISYFTLKGYIKIRFADVRFFSVIDNKTVAFYSEKPRNKFKPAMGGVPVSGMQVPKRQLISMITDRLKAYGAVELF